MIHAVADALSDPFDRYSLPAKCTAIMVPASFSPSLRAAIVLGDRAYDADWIGAQIKGQGAIAKIPNNATGPIAFASKTRSTVSEISLNVSRIKHYRRVATRYGKPGANFLAMAKLAVVRLWLRQIESTAEFGTFRRNRRSRR